LTDATARGRLPVIEPSIRKPPFENAEYARAISIGLTASPPSPIEK
jgi:hypothetical protein